MAARPFEQLRRRLKELREDFEAGGTEYRALMRKPNNRPGDYPTGGRGLRSTANFWPVSLWARTTPIASGSMPWEHYIEAARERNEAEVEVLVRDVNEALGLNQAWPNICQVLTGPKFLQLANVEAPEQIGADQSSATTLRFHLDRCRRSTGRRGGGIAAGWSWWGWRARAWTQGPAREGHRRGHRCALDILPKIDGDGDDKQVIGSIRRRLVHMLAVAMDLRIDAGQVTALDWQQEMLLEILIRLFSTKLIDSVRQGMPSRYLQHQDDLPVLRGRIDVTRQFTTLAADPARLACRYDALTPDIALNQIMKVASCGYPESRA